jgi:sulfate adenylyltransferase
MFQLNSTEEIALADSFNNFLAILRVEEIYNWGRNYEELHVSGTTDSRHPLVAEMNSWGGVCLSGELKVLQPPPRYDFRMLRMVPVEVRRKLRSDEETLLLFRREIHFTELTEK